MKANEFDVTQFLDRYHISLNNYNFNKILEEYIDEMQKGLDGESSIPMLPTYIEEKGEIPAGKPVLVLDAGGTNFRAAIVEFSESNKAVISNYRKRKMPGLEKELGREEFFDAIADFAADLAADVDRIGFCFSYPMIKTYDKDGRLMKFSKEIKAPEVEGELIGAGVLAALRKRNIKNIKKIVLLNDTIATLLAGKTAGDSGVYGAYIGLILGTGVNASYNESNSCIGKVDNLPGNGYQLINMEAGSCAVFPSGNIDEKFRSETANPEAYKFEKMVSGGYLGALWITVLKSAAENSAFSEQFGDALNENYKDGQGYDASVLSKFLAEGVLPEPLAVPATKPDTEIVRKLSEAVVSRAAYLAAIMLAGIIRKSAAACRSDKPVCICADGSTFWKLHGLKEQIEENLQKFSEQSGLKYKITGIDDAPIIGAAVAGLTN